MIVRNTWFVSWITFKFPAKTTANEVGNLRGESHNAGGRARVLCRRCLLIDRTESWWHARIYSGLFLWYSWLASRHAHQRYLVQTDLLQQRLNDLSPHLWFERSSQKDRDNVKASISSHLKDETNPPILIFPEVRFVFFNFQNST